jgi:ketosteroid isomerase-like protein
MAPGGSSLPFSVLPVLAVALLALFGGWLMLGSYVTNDRDGCAERYQLARTAADTAAVDSLVPERDGRRGTQCGFLRYAARWPAGDSAQQDSMLVHAIAEGIIAADNGRDLITVLNYYADSAVLVPPGEAPVTGIGEIQRRYQALFAAWQPAIEPRIDEVVVTGTRATVRGHNGGWLRAMTAGGADRALDDDYTMTLERRGGVWQIHRLQWTRNP